MSKRYIERLHECPFSPEKKKRIRESFVDNTVDQQDAFVASDAFTARRNSQAGLADRFITSRSYGAFAAYHTNTGNDQFDADKKSKDHTANGATSATQSNDATDRLRTQKGDNHFFQHNESPYN